MKVKILKDSKYSHQTVHIPVSKGDIVELPQFVENVWLKNGTCEELKAAPKKETKVVSPVVETKKKAKAKK